MLLKLNRGVTTASWAIAISKISQGQHKRVVPIFGLQLGEYLDCLQRLLKQLPLLQTR
jgi:hypothetical protein